MSIYAFLHSFVGWGVLQINVHRVHVMLWLCGGLLLIRVGTRSYDEEVAALFGVLRYCLLMLEGLIVMRFYPIRYVCLIRSFLYIIHIIFLTRVALTSRYSFGALSLQLLLYKHELFLAQVTQPSIQAHQVKLWRLLTAHSCHQFLHFLLGTLPHFLIILI